MKQAREQRVRGVVKHHEAGVDRDGAAGAGFGGLDGVGVAADVVRRFEEREVVVALQEMGAAEAGDAGADDGEARLGHGRKGGG